MLSKVFASAAVSAIVVVPAAVSAHHPHATFYDQCTTLTIDGEIDSLEWKSPHVHIDIKANNGKAYRAEWTSPAILKQMSVEPPKVGDRVVVRANPMRDEAAIRAKYADFKAEPSDTPVVDLRQIRRASDGWNWGAEPTPPPDCGRK